MRIAFVCLIVLATAARADELPLGAVLRIGSSGLRHNTQVMQAAWSPDGKRLASAAASERVKIWEPRTGRLIASLPAANHEVTLAWAPDGKSIAVGGWSHGGVSGERLTLWDVETGKAVRHYPVPERECALAVAFSPDGKLLASGSITNKVYLWDAATARLVRTLQDGAQWAKTLAFSPDGKLLAAGGQDKLIRLWDVPTGKLRSTLKDHPSDIYQLCFSPDGKTLASGDSLDTYVRLWDVETGKPRRFWKSGVGYVSALAWSPDGKRLATSASSNSILHVVDVQTGKSVGELHNPKHGIRGAAYHPDGKTLATAGVEGVVRLWDMETLKEKPLPPGHLRTVTALAFSADGTRLLTGSSDQTARVWELKTGKEALRLDWPDHYWISSVAFSADGAALAVGGHNETRLFDGRTGKGLRQLKGQEGVAWHMAWAPDGKTLVTGSNGGTVRWWDTASGQKRREEPYPFPTAWGLHFRRDGVLLADASKDSGVWRHEWDGKKDVLHTSSRMWTSTVVPALSPDGRTLAAVEEGNAIHLWETSTFQLRLRFVSDQKEPIRSLAFSADGWRLATGSDDSTVLIWDTMGTKDEVIQRLREDLDSCWLRLGSQGAGEAYRAIRALASVPDKAAPFLDRCLQGTNEKTRAITKLIADLASPRFAVREKATKDLIWHAQAARAQLETALEGKLELDARRRIEGILARLPKESLPQLVRDLRALEALERMGTPAARAVLKRLAAGQAEARLTREAKAAVLRLGE